MTVVRPSSVFFALFLSTALPLSTAWASPNEDLLGSAQDLDVAGVASALAAGADVNARAALDGSSALSLALASRAKLHAADVREIEKLLIAKGANVNARDNVGLSPLFWAISPNYDVEIPELLITAGANINDISEHGRPALMSAGFGNFELADFLIARGADVNATDNKGRTALADAAGGNDIGYVKYLIAHKANPNAKLKDGLTPLLLTDSVAVAEVLIAAGADVNATYNIEPNVVRTALLSAATRNEVEMVKLLVSAGADVHAHDDLGFNAMVFAALRGKDDIVRVLIDKGCDVNERFPDGSTALMWAARAGHVETVKLLISKGADVNAVPKSGLTAMQGAISNCHIDVIEVLAAAGATSEPHTWCKR